MNDVKSYAVPTVTVKPATISQELAQPVFMASLVPCVMKVSRDNCN